MALQKELKRMQKQADENQDMDKKKKVKRNLENLEQLVRD